MTRLRLLQFLPLACLLTVVHAGCASKSDQGPALNALGQHPANWIVAHRAAYQNAPNQCVECHGADLKGGIAKVDCFNQAGLATCHAGGHGPRIANHPIPFKDPLLHGPAAKQDLTNCQQCHSDNPTGGPGSNPRFNVPIGTLAAGCEDCHPHFAAHPATWRGHNSSANQTAACTLCHGVLFAGGNGPACQTCHASTPAPGTCSSCHAAPPNGLSPNGGGRPNRPGSHQAHNALALVQGNCSVCHSGAGTGTAVHYARVLGNATTAVRATYNARSGAASYDATAQRCSNVKCHGGQLTPVWGTPLDVTTQCSSCHILGTALGVPQYNSYYSGLHDFHFNTQHLACTDCHDMSNQTPPAHFSNLSSAGFDQAPSVTIRSYISYNKTQTPPTCSPGTPPAGNAVGVCHGLRSWVPAP